MRNDDNVTDASAAEDELLRLGVHSVRVVAVEDDAALLLAPSTQITAITQEPLRSEVIRVVQGSGFARVGVWRDL